jgi:hypothetical protein
MTETTTRPTRVIAIDPTTKGFGYAILDLPKHLVAWGMAHVEGEKRSGAIFRFEALLDQFRPDAVVLEDTTAQGSRRYPRVRDLLEVLARVARERGLEVHTVSRLGCVHVFSLILRGHRAPEPARDASFGRRPLRGGLWAAGL